MEQVASDDGSDGYDTLSDIDVEFQYLNEKRECPQIKQKRKTVNDIKPEIFTYDISFRLENEEFVPNVGVRNADDIADRQDYQIMQNVRKPEIERGKNAVSENRIPPSDEEVADFLLMLVP